MATEPRAAKCISLSQTMARELAIAAAMERRTQSGIIEELLEGWLDTRRRGTDPAQQKLPEGGP